MDENVGIAGVIDVAFGRLHADDAAAGEEVAEYLFPSRDWVCGVGNVGVIDHKDAVSRVDGGGREDAETLNRGATNFDR